MCLCYYTPRSFQFRKVVELSNMFYNPSGIILQYLKYFMYLIYVSTSITSSSSRSGSSNSSSSSSGTLLPAPVNQRIKFQFQVTKSTDKVTIDRQIEKIKNDIIIVVMHFLCYKDGFYLQKLYNCTARLFLFPHGTTCKGIFEKKYISFLHKNYLK